VLVNIPAFEAYLIRGGVPELTSRVIVGKPKTPTPTFESELKYLVLNPTWTVPRSIASNEMLPTIRNDPAYLARFGYLLLDHSGSPVDPGDVNWAAQSRNNFAYTLVQQPGPANQLGRIKFMMPNEYAVFMHDTPSVNLFNLASRAFSHGCIRVQDPFELATALMRDTGLDGEPLESRVAAGDTQTVFFAKPVAIRIVYHTANSDGGQNVRFFDDVYDLDKELLKALDAGR
jgi:murein L,D-transpeptidase YcbB/YkuD